jgi:hypothetical protein
MKKKTPENETKTEKKTKQQEDKNLSRSPRGQTGY